MSRHCDRCGRWMLSGGFALSNDWRQFCYRCLFAAAWEPPQPVRPDVRRRIAAAGHASAAIRAVTDGSITASQYFDLVKRGEHDNAVAVALEQRAAERALSPTARAEQSND